MKRNEWKKSYTILCENNFQYFGEVSTTSGQSKLEGTSILYYPANGNYSMLESYKNNIFSGLCFTKTKSENVAFPTFQAGLYKVNRYVGPLVSVLPYEYKTKDSYNFDIIFSNTNDSGRNDGAVIYIAPLKETFTILQYSNGVKQNKSIRFDKGHLYLEKLIDNTNKEVVNTIECGWNFNPSSFGLLKLPKNCLGFENHGFKPAFTDYVVENGKTEHYYYGMVETYGDGATYIVEDNKRIFTDEVAHYGIIEYKNKDKYFGEVIADGDEGGFKRTGFGCFRGKNDAYIGNYTSSLRNGVGLTIKGSTAAFGNYNSNKKTGLYFEIDGNKLLVYYMIDDKRKGKYYVIDSNTFKVEERDGSGKTTLVATFDKKVESTSKSTDDPVISGVDPAKLRTLANYNFTYEVINDNIYLTGVNQKGKDTKEMHIPGFVKGIRKNAFQGLKKLEFVEIFDGVEFIDEGAFRDCPNIKKLILPNTITTIEAHTFESKQLERVDFPSHVKLIKSYAFLECSRLKWITIGNKNCVIEENAFPKVVQQDLKKYERKKEDEPEQKTKVKATKEKIKVPKTRTRRKRSIIVNFFRGIGQLFGIIFGSIFYFFVKLIPGLFKKIFTKKSRSHGGSFFSKIGSFFAMIGRGILFVITAPFRLVKKLSSSPSFLDLLFILIMGAYLMLGITSWIKYVSWDTVWWPGFFGYHWELGSFGVSLMSTHEFWPGLLGIIITIVGGLIDIIIYLLMIIFVYVIFVCLQIIIQLGIIFVIPAAIPIYLLVMTIKADDKLEKIVTFIITLGLSITYFIFLSQLL